MSPSDRLILGALSLSLTACPASTNPPKQTTGTPIASDSRARSDDAGGQEPSGGYGALSREALVPVVAAGRREVTKCFESAADCAAKARFRIGPSGDVVEVSVRRISGEELAPSIRECIEGEIEKWRFPAASGDTWLSHIWECKKD